MQLIGFIVRCVGSGCPKKLWLIFCFAVGPGQFQVLMPSLVLGGKMAALLQSNCVQSLPDVVGIA